MGFYSPSDIGRTTGRADSAGVNLNVVDVDGLFKTLARFSKSSKEFNVEMRKVAYIIAKNLEKDVKVEAGTVSRASQALQVAKGLKARNERIPTIKLSGNLPFVSKSRPNKGNKRRGVAARGKRVLLSDVFFGAEFGGGKYPSTKQFLRHRGRAGYFFWPTIRKKKNDIAREYLAGLDRVVKELGL